MPTHKLALLISHTLISDNKNKVEEKLRGSEKRK